MKAIEQAIEARALKLANSRLDDKRGTYEWSLDAEITLRECAAALTALREAVKQEPVAWRDAVQRLVTGFEHVSGIARAWEPDHSSGADRSKWARATEACADVAKLLTTPQAPKAEPVLLTDAEIDAISLKQWGNQIGALAAAHRAYARAVEAEVIRRGGGQS